MKSIITNGLLAAGLTLIMTGCGDKEENKSSGEKSDKKGQIANENSEAELKAKLNEALVKEMFGEVKDLKSHYMTAMGFPQLSLQFESSGEYFSVSLTKGTNSGGDPILDSISRNYTDGEFVKGIGDRAYLNRKLKNISVVDDGVLYHVSCIKRVTLDEERTKTLAKKILAE